MVTLWLPVAKKAGDREVVLKVRKDLSTAVLLTKPIWLWKLNPWKLPSTAFIEA